MDCKGTASFSPLPFFCNSNIKVIEIMDNTIALRNEKIGKLLWKFSWPAVVAMLVNSLYNIIDRIFVGRGVGAIAIAATTVAFPIMLIFMAVSVLIGVGATSLISIRLGEQKPQEAEKLRVMPWHF